MSDDSEDAWLIALGAAVSDGGIVDWDRARLRGETPDQQRLIQELRDLAVVVNAHRPDGHTAVPAPLDCATSIATPTEWRHLVLFEAIGAGAFGRVYRGWDPQLDREVAVKLLAKGRIARPLDEARNLARVRHSNVVVVYGADEIGDEVGIWMELIEGETLAQIVRERGPMSAREVAGIGLDLCSALAAIHAAGLLHRDIKAHNVMREVGGRIVLMDFSGAQALIGEGAPALMSGTPLYMAPELFAGSPPSSASDVYSLGVLLFFLLSGSLPVDGASLHDVKQAHLRRERKHLRDLRSDVPDALLEVIERSIAPDVNVRYRSAGELERALASASGSQSISARLNAASAGQNAPASRGRGWGAAAILLAFVAIAVGLISRTARPATPVVARFTVGPPYVAGSWPRISPDGTQVVFGTIVEGRNRFWIRSLRRLEGRPLMETTANESPFWSPDSRTLAFFDDGKLYRIDVDGGGPRLLADAPQPRGGDWSGSTLIYGRRDGIYRIDVKGGAPQRLTTIDVRAGDYQHGWPEFLPDGRRFVYLVRSSQPGRSGIYLGALDGSQPRRLLPDYSRALYADEHLLYVRDGVLTAHPFDPRTGTFDGEAVAIASGVKFHAGSDAAFDVSASGVLIYSVTPGQPSTRLVLFDRRGRELRALTDIGSFGHPRFSPDGQRIAAEKVDREDNNADLWIYGVTRPSATRLTRNSAPDVRPVWSPDGRQIAFSSKRGSEFDVFAKTVDGVEDERLLSSGPGDEYVEHWSPDGQHLVGTVLRSGLWLLTLATPEKPRMLHGAARRDTWQAEFSPDGRWLAYMATESGGPEVYVEPFPPNGSRWQVSTHGGAEPHWRRDMPELLYLDADSVLTAVRFSGPGWNPTPPQRLFPLAVPDLAGRADYAVSPDGRLLVVNTFISDPIVPPVEVVLNWTGLLPR